MGDLLHSRAFLLLEKDLFKIKEKCSILKDIKIDTSESLFSWKVSFYGLTETFSKQCQENSITVYIQFDENYNRSPPKLLPQYISNHLENIDLSVCFHKWNETSSLIDALVKLRDIVREKSTFQRLLHLQYEATKSSKETNEEKKYTQQEIQKPRTKHCKLSFENYHDSWKKLGTTKPDNVQQENLLINLVKKCNIADTSFTEGTQADKQLDFEIMRQLSEHNHLMYGQFQSNKTKKIKRLKSMKADLLKEINCSVSRQENISKNSKNNSKDFHQDESKSRADNEDEFMAIEAKELLSWAEKLPFDVTE